MVYLYSTRNLEYSFLCTKGLKASETPTIEKHLMQEGFVPTWQEFTKRYENTGSIGRLPGSWHRSKVTDEVKKIVEDQMKANDETSAFLLH